MVSTRIGTNRNEIKVGIESMVRCGGACGGCILSATERVRGDIWSQERFDRAGEFIKAFLSGHVNSGTSFHEVSVTFGQGDHFLLGENDADRIVDWTSRLYPGKVVGFITASAIGKRERVQRSVDAWAAAMHRHGQAFNVDMVFDPAKVAIGSFSRVYADNISYIKQAFGDFDLNINVGPDTPRAVSPKGLRKFVTDNGFSRLTLNLVPLPSMASQFFDRWGQITDWLNGCLEEWDPELGYSINFCPTIAPLIEGADDRFSDDGMARVISVVEQRLTREIYIDSEGRISHTQAGFGDVPLSHRFGFDPVIDIDTHPSDAASAVATSAGRFSTRIASIFASKPACRECHFRDVCPQIGAAALAKSMKGLFDPLACPTGIKLLLDRVETFMNAGRDLANASYSDLRVHVPHDFDTDLLPNSRRVNAHGTRIDFHDIETERTT